MLRRKIFTEKKVALVCAAVLIGLSIFPVLKYAGVLDSADGPSSLHNAQQAPAVEEKAAEGTSAAEQVPVVEETETEEFKTEEVAQPATESSEDVYSYTAEAGGSYTLAVRQAVSSYVTENNLSVDESQLLAAEVNIVNAAGAPYLEIGEVVTISRADVAKEFPAAPAAESAEIAKARDDAADTQKQDDSSTQDDAAEGAEKQDTVTTADFVRTAVAGDSYTIIAREAIKSAAAGSLNDAQKIAAETYLANQAGFPELAVGQNVTLSGSAIQDALTFARGLTVEQQAAWQAYVPAVVF